MRTRSLGLPLALLALSALVGCDRASTRRTVTAPPTTNDVTPSDLFEVGVLSARYGDSLRAEQYLGAARAHGYDEAIVTYWLVRVCLEAGRYQSALGHAAGYLRDHPGHWVLRLVVATIHEALGELDRARAELERVVEARPLEPLAHYRLAMLYQRLGSSASSRARPHLEAYLELAPRGVHAEEVRDALRRPRFFELDGSPPSDESAETIGTLP